jgi:hypothetical protein
MGCIHQAGQLFRRNQGHVFGAPSPHNHHFLIVRDLVQDRSQPFPQARVSSLHRHRIFLASGAHSFPVRIVKPACRRCLLYLMLECKAMAEAILSSKNQIVIPREAREALHLRLGDKLLLVVC